jgi:ketosteroid isomerase-like protein
MARMDLLGAIRERDREALAAMVADDVVFHSPVTTYRGRDQVVDLLAILGSVFEDITRTREVETVTFLKGHAGGEELDGALVEIKDGDGRVAEITLLLRPLAGIQAGVRLMARALAEGADPTAE